MHSQPLWTWWPGVNSRQMPAQCQRHLPSWTKHIKCSAKRPKRLLASISVIGFLSRYHPSARVPRLMVFIGGFHHPSGYFTISILFGFSVSNPALFNVFVLFIQNDTPRLPHFGFLKSNSVKLMIV